MPCLRIPRLSSGLDAVAAYQSMSGTQWFPNTAGTFGPGRPFGSDAYGVELADVDEDGDLDVLAAGAGTVSVSWYDNLGGGFIGRERVILSPPAAETGFAVEAADLDGDGHLDVLARHGSELVWFRNDLCWPPPATDTATTDTVTPTTDTATPTSTDSATTQGGPAVDKAKGDGGCGCSSSGSLPWQGLLLLLALATTRVRGLDRDE